MDDRDYMRLALEEAKIAFEEQEVPVGAILVKDGNILAKSHNICEKSKNLLLHAEISVIEKVYQTSDLKYLTDCTLYVTMEPCPMCAGAILHSRISKVVFGVKDPRAGAMGSLLNLPAYPLESKPTVIGGVLEEDCQKLLSDFFKIRREK